MTKPIKKMLESNRLASFVFICLAVVFFSAAGLRVYFTGSAIANAMENKKNFDKITELSRQKVSLEKKYIETASKFDIDYAYENGFIDQTKNIAFAIRSVSIAQR